MQWQQFIISLFSGSSRELEKILEGLTIEDLNQRPKNDCNTIGWIAWHLTRIQDRSLEEITGEKQLWIASKWYEIFGRQPDPNETGTGHTEADIVAFKSPDSATILAYHSAVAQRYANYLNSRLSEEELQRKFDKPLFPHITVVYKMLAGVIWESNQHLGQAAYLRGLLKGRGWSPI